ncbi:hypothetical protein OIU84_023419 [Salix udensis]|uniref:Uncharacterized protein n=1 Tax=Salix udensis TaxID=889485 RepID=A0AAD6KQR5_9ROSI|nr:hypothetical protein OIU84_023419 [Salix udensis]
MAANGVFAESRIKRMPLAKPPFTLGQIKKAIPPHCFERSLLRSFSYVVYDLCISFLLFYIAATYFHRPPPSPLACVAWPIYWILQGCILTGVWVIAHECSHHAFSDYKWVDDAVGLILHSAFLVPILFLEIQPPPPPFEHRVPRPRRSVRSKDKVPSRMDDDMIASPVTMIPSAPFILIVKGFRFSFLIWAFSLQLFVLYSVAVSQGLAFLICIYGVPLLIVNGFLVTVTFLQHTHPALPHYDSSEWEWLKGALATMDRDYGILNKVFHNITDTHVAHHLFSNMPHYHAMEATRAMKPVLGEFYQFDDTPVYKAIWREAKRMPVC